MPVHFCSQLGSFEIASRNHSLGVLLYYSWTGAWSAVCDENHSPCIVSLLSDSPRSHEWVGGGNSVDPSDVNATQVFVTGMWVGIVLLQQDCG
jgi:hypothetical protein